MYEQELQFKIEVNIEHDLYLVNALVFRDMYYFCMTDIADFLCGSKCCFSKTYKRHSLYQRTKCCYTLSPSLVNLLKCS